MKTFIRELLFELTGSSGISGRESDTAELVKNRLAPLVDEVSITKLGSVLAVKKGKKPVRKLLLDAHIDEIGMIVTDIDDSGFLHFRAVSGVDPKTLLSAEVTITGKERLYGVICCMPPHLISDDDQKKAPKIQDMVIDIGYDAKRAKELVRIGDAINFISPAAEALNSRLVGKAFDNRGGVAAIIAALKMLENERFSELAGDIYVLASVSEETNGAGALTGAFLAQPDEAIVIDVSHAYTPDAEKDKCGEMSAGVMIGISPTLSKTMCAKLKSIAKEKGIAHQLEVMPGSTHTNAEHIAFSRGGAAVALLSIPLKYMHTQQELIDICDVESTARLVAEYIKDGGHDA